MAQLILQGGGSATGLLGVLGVGLGKAIDGALSVGLSPVREAGPRIAEVRLTGAAEGAPTPCVFGRARVAGQVIWAARFREHRRDAGGKAGRARGYGYSLSLALAVGEGPIDGIGRVWADGKVMDMAGVTMRVHRGTEDQLPDPLIAAIEGEAPAYRGTAYVVFEDLALDAFGGRPPQLSFEVFRRPGVDGTGLEDRLESVCLIPGAGEFVLATDVVLRREGLTRTSPENQNNTEGRADLLVSLDQLQAQLPNVRRVNLVVSWFGTDLRCGACEIRPGVEAADKATEPMAWRVAGLEREEARLISQSGGGVAYGGTPSDAAVIQAIAELKRRGLEVTLYPFVLMDVPAGAGLADPYGGAEQAAYPWRGRITCHPAPGRVGSPHKTSAATAQAAAFFDGEWGFARFVRHYAQLAAQAGGVDGFLIGSELVGLTRVRDAAGFPAVDALRALAGEARALLGAATKIGYAADWSEYFGSQPADGSGDVHFHLDPLWADPDIDFVGIDYYPPITDWRDGEDHLDAAAGWGGPHDPAYLRHGLTGGEGFDWFYASAEDRAAQVRTPITDGAHGEPWVFRPKDLLSWWSNPHHDRPGGVRAATPTAWVPRSKPIRLIEFGCGAVDKGANAPNLFVDAKSAESALPPFSDGTADELGQRRALEAVLAMTADPAANPVSPVYGGPMIEEAAAWCWDARPFPDFPARAEVWADAPNWRLGHWLNGRAGAAALGELVMAVAARAGVEIDPGEAAGSLGGMVAGYVIDRPMRVRDALAPLTEAFGLEAVERGGRVRLVSRSGPAQGALGGDDLAWPEDRPAPASAARRLEEAADAVRLRFIDLARDYQAGGLIVRDGAGALTLDVEAPLVLTAAQAGAIARRRLDGQGAARRERIVHLSPLAALTWEAGDRLALDGETWRVTRVDVDERPRMTLIPASPAVSGAMGEIDWRPAPPRPAQGPPVLMVLDLPPLPGAEDDARPLVAVAAQPWRAFDVHAGPDVEALRVRASATTGAVVGTTLSDLPAGPRHRIDRGTRLIVRLEGGAPQSRSRAAVLAGENLLAVRGPGGWELLQFITAQAVGPDAFALTGLLRGQGGSDVADLVAAGADVVLIDEGLVRAQASPAERGLPLIWRAAPAGGPPAGPAMRQVEATWRGAALRPWSPAHLRARTVGGDMRLSWIRRARVGGDGWEAEVPLSEASEAWRVQILDGEAVVRTVETATPGFVWTAAMRAADLPSGPMGALRANVAQGSATWGWGAPATIAL
ncbi:baseplate multidomain protein megatron [Caulobacter endophyticus]|uniref:baseplate multidomain protein megatron n=1 Tax=Caulobacter endophyticus TaxID=2172652 RepID=UPI00240EB394|nr:glycoside hydrolase/phage tail family protein [Caulobacter endophyticus]MDG2527543.1 glycoside hydrolase/phage tail family protein [Caulobacter endophyticus]